MKKFPICEDHKESEKEFIQLGEYDVKLCCNSCILQLQDSINQVNFQNIIHLKTVKAQPEQLLYGILPKNKYVLFNDFLQITHLTKLIEKCMYSLKSIKKVIENLMSQAKIKLNEIYQIQEEMRKKLEEVIKFDCFDQCFSENQSDGPENIEQFENTIFTKIQQLKNQIVQFSDQVNGSSNWVQQTKTQKSWYYDVFLTITKMFEAQYCEIQRGFSFQFLQNPLVDFNYLEFLCNTIERRQNQQLKCANDYLSGPQQVIIDQEYLLMIFKSNSGNIFGTYTPCKWVLQECQHDSTLTSFIFSYTTQEIFPLKPEYKQYTQSLKKSQYKYTLTFGGSGKEDWDIKIDDDFNYGSSKLGVAYGKIGKKYSQELLFCDSSPRVKFMEIYKLHFLQ